MIGKIFGVTFSIFIIALSIILLYDNLPHAPVNMSLDNTDNEDTISYVEYGATPVFSENLRFGHTNISYFIEPNCPRVRRDAMKEAFQLFEDTMKVITFYEFKSPSADIVVGCSGDYIPMGENLFAAGEGGPSEIINTSTFKVIKKGKISLYEDPKCKDPIVETHELLHVFGFDHTQNKKSVMYNISRCGQKITPDMVELIQDLYTIPAYADLKIFNISAIKKGKYLDFNITVLNEGLADVSNVSLKIVSEEEIIQETFIGELKIGHGRTLTAQNIMLKSRGVESVDFIISTADGSPELDVKNNIASLSVQSP